MADDAFTRRPDGSIVYTFEGGLFVLEPDDAALIPPDVDSGNLSDYGLTLDVAEPPPAAQATPPGPMGSTQAMGGKPPWWDDLRSAASGNLPAWEELGMKEGEFGTDADGNTTFGEPMFDISLFNRQLSDAKKSAETLGLIDQPVESDGYFDSEQEAADAAPPGYEPVYQGNGRWDFQQSVPEAAPKSFRDTASAQRWVNERGYPEGSYTIEPSASGWVVKTDPIKGQLHSTYASAQQSAPPGFQPQQLSNGMWGYERVPETPQQRYSSYDDFILQKFVDGDVDAAIAADRFRDLIQRPQFEVRDFLSLAGQVMSFASNGQEFTEIMGMVTGMINQPITDPFAAQVQSAASTLDASLGGPGSIGASIAGGPASPVGGGGPPTPTQEAGFRIVAHSEADKARREAVEAGADPGEVEDAANAAFERVMGQVPDYQESQRQARVNRDPFADVEFGTQQRGGTTESIIRNQDGTVSSERVFSNLTPEQKEAERQRAMDAFDASVAAGTNFATNEAGERVELTFDDFAPSFPEVNERVEDADASSVMARQRSSSRQQTSRPARRQQQADPFGELTSKLAGVTDKRKQKNRAPLATRFV